MVRQAHHEGRLSLTLALSQRERGLAPSATPRCTVHYRAPPCHSECSEESTLPRLMVRLAHHERLCRPHRAAHAYELMVSLSNRQRPSSHSRHAPTPPQIATSAARLLATTVAIVPSLRGETKERRSQARLRPHAGLHEAVVSVYTGAMPQAVTYLAKRLLPSPPSCSPRCDSGPSHTAA